ncbi:MAG: DUF1934 domain-containing protein [Lachnospiraceae bacterium]|nr:DUF1934 domain-containing protein [Lachnospiraceae bacterium]
MKQNVRISVTGQNGADAPIKTEYDGKLLYKEPYYYASYEEQMDPDSAESSHTVLRFDEKSLRVTRRGAVESVLFYEPGKTWSAPYSTPLMDFSVTLLTTEFSAEHTEKEIRLQVRYRIGFNDASPTTGNLQIHIYFT